MEDNGYVVALRADTKEEEDILSYLSCIKRDTLFPLLKEMLRVYGENGHQYTKFSNTYSIKDTFGSYAIDKIYSQLNKEVIDEPETREWLGNLEYSTIETPLFKQAIEEFPSILNNKYLDELKQSFYSKDNKDGILCKDLIWELYDEYKVPLVPIYIIFKEENTDEVKIIVILFDILRCHDGKDFAFKEYQSMCGYIYTDKQSDKK